MQYTFPSYWIHVTSFCLFYFLFSILFHFPQFSARLFPSWNTIVPFWFLCCSTMRFCYLYFKILVMYLLLYSEWAIDGRYAWDLESGTQNWLGFQSKTLKLCSYTINIPPELPIDKITKFTAVWEVWVWVWCQKRMTLPFGSWLTKIIHRKSLKIYPCRSLQFPSPHSIHEIKAKQINKNISLKYYLNHLVYFIYFSLRLHLFLPFSRVLGCILFPENKNKKSRNTSNKSKRKRVKKLRERKRTWEWNEWMNDLFIRVICDVELLK